MKIIIKGSSSSHNDSIQSIVSSVVSNMTGITPTIHINYDRTQTPNFINSFPSKLARSSAQNYQRSN